MGKKLVFAGGSRNPYSSLRNPAPLAFFTPKEALYILWLCIAHSRHLMRNSTTAEVQQPCHLPNSSLASSASRAQWGLSYGTIVWKGAVIKSTPSCPSSQRVRQWSPSNQAVRGLRPGPPRQTEGLGSFLVLGIKRVGGHIKINFITAGEIQFRTEPPQLS